VGHVIIEAEVIKMAIQGVLLDLSGVLYVGHEALPGAVAALDRLRTLGLPVRFITNTTRSPRRKILAQLEQMGLEVPEKELFTAPSAVRDVLLERGLRPSLLIHPGLSEEFDDFDVRDPNVVVIGDAGEAFDYEHMNSAFRLLMEGAEFIAMGNNRYFREADGLSLDIGPFVSALEYATGRKALILGKPSSAFFHQAVASMGVEPENVLMVGDDVTADVEGAMEAGLMAALVRTGKYRPADEDSLRDTRAWIEDDISAVVERLIEGVE
jgi:HAD superfamily hydrolase (TIGR01458 family)